MTEKKYIVIALGVSLVIGICLLSFLAGYIFGVKKGVEKTQKVFQEKIILLETEIKNLKKAESAGEKTKKFLENLDMQSDTSLQKFVNSKVAFVDKKYVPENLEFISSAYVYDAKGASQKLRNEANLALQELAKAFYKEFGKKMSVVSAYRSYNYQAGIKARGCPDNLCAKAGYSEHQSGLAVDFWEASSQKEFLSKANLKQYFKWLSENAHKYGFHNTYQKGLEVDGYEIEPWHWRYLGKKFATELKNKNITIAEYYFKREKKSLDF